MLHFVNLSQAANYKSELLAQKLIDKFGPERARELFPINVNLDRDLQINGFSSGWGAYRWGGSRSGAARAEEITVGTLVVDMIDARTRTIVWRGTASKDVDQGASAEKRDKHARKAMEKLFKNYPPKA